jgi:NAD(P)-dependent dehydrogenase (short-subunit alcohol dehydrogenase family)
MNICVFGGGGKTGHFGPDFCARARSQGHDVTVISHQAHDDCVVADFGQTQSVVNCFQKIATTKSLDLVLYNTTAPSFPDQPTCFDGSHLCQEQGWIDTVRIHAMIPHAVSLCAMQHMPAGSAVVFMTSGLSWEHDRNYATWAAGYAGGKAMQNHLMLALAQHNDHDIVFTSVAPHFVPETYPAIFDKIYDHVMNLDASFNGRIHRVWD